MPSLSISNPILNTFYDISYILLNRYALVAVRYLFLNLFCISQKTQNYVKFTAFFLKKWILFFTPTQLLFLLDNAKKKLYANVPEMVNFHSKTCSQKYPISSSWYNFFNTNVSDFYCLFTAKN